MVDSGLLTAAKKSQLKKRPVGIALLGIPLIFLRMLSLCWSGFAFRFGALTATFGD